MNISSSRAQVIIDRCRSLGKGGLLAPDDVTQISERLQPIADGGRAHRSLVPRYGDGQLMRVTTEEYPGLHLVLVFVEGELDLATCPEASRALRAGLRVDGCRVLVVDLTAVTFLGAAALRVLVELRAHVVERHVELRLVISSRPVWRPFEAAGLLDQFTVCGFFSAAADQPLVVPSTGTILPDWEPGRLPIVP